MQRSHLVADEVVVVESVREHGDALTAREQMQREPVGIRLSPELLELAAQPSAEQREELVGFGLRTVIELRELRAQRADGTTVPFDLVSVCDEHVDEAANTVRRSLPCALPLLEHLRGALQARRDHRVEDLVLRLEVMIEVAARDLHRVRDVGERGVLVAATIEQPSADSTMRSRVGNAYRLGQAS